jgi:hypothetical protein
VTLRKLPAAIGVLFATIGITMPAVVLAQGNGRPKTAKPVATTSPASGTLAPATTFPQFGSWLDDASAAAKGEGAISIGAGYWRLAGMTQTNMPMLGGAIGVTDRLQVSASVPFYRASASTWSARGVDDMYLSAKYTVLDPTLTVSEFGLALSPVVEVLSADAPDGRVHFALPVSVEIRRLPFRMYGSAGYFTRGAVFGGGAIEWTAPVGVSFTGNVMQSYSVEQPVLPDGMVASRRHVDVGVGAAAPLGARASVYANVGRSLTSVDAGGASLAVSGGLAVRFSAAAN